MSVALGMFSRIGIVHADLKPENILLEYDSETQTITNMKIIDLGSSFLLNQQGEVFQNQSEFMQSTPEYLPPEIQSFLAKRFSHERNIRV